ncbi:MAG: pyruvate, phosphate dikinase [Lentisphaerales bacterium]|nr:pyruvate, phosphate dikinase [Lentisphaerales bacterium]
MISKNIYLFTKKATDGSADMREVLGGKGANLAEMKSMGIPVPPGFTVPCYVCNSYHYNKQSLPDGLMNEVKEAISIIEDEVGAKFGSLTYPLLLSVRSGARVSMPGMMDTVLNLGLNDQAVIGLAKVTANEHMAYDSYRRFIEMFSDVVREIPVFLFEDVLDEIKEASGLDSDNELSVENLKEVCTRFKEIYKEEIGEEFPQDPFVQLQAAISSVFHSWQNERAVLYRKMEKIPCDWRTAVNVQAMVFGNKGSDSATGVAFTRNPSTGEKVYYGEYLTDAQGEDVVAGIRTPIPISAKLAKKAGFEGQSLEELMPQSFKELGEVFESLEQHFKDMQDIEFTIDNGKLFILQARNGKRTGFAQIKIAVDMVSEGIISPQEGLLRIQPNSLEQLLSPVFNLKDKEEARESLIGTGLNAGPGAATGKLALSSEKAVEYSEAGVPSILVRLDTSPSDFGGMMAAKGVLTARGGATSHAAVVARQFGKPCVCGLSALKIDENARTLSADGKMISEGDDISIDGTTGEVFFKEIKTSPSEVSQVLIEESMSPEESIVFQNYQMIINWADKYKKMSVRTNADTPRDVNVALHFGAVGIGLTRIEHMFHGEQRLLPLRKLFLSDSPQMQIESLKEIQTFIAHDFKDIFRVLNGLPATIRLLDPPMHEFMPKNDREIVALAESMGITDEEVKQTLKDLSEVNPMLGHRGCRLGVSSPGITSMQVRAILESALTVTQEGIPCKPEIMVPIVMSATELEHQRQVVDKAASELFAELGESIEYTVGTMVELPRAALRASQIAEHAEFFSFGTNDLTQTTFGISRDDAGKFLPIYSSGVPYVNGEGQMEIYPNDPFQVLDQEGVGELIKIGVERGRLTKQDLKIGICGEHGGEPSSVEFCHRAGLDYVSCSPYRVPIAILAAAQAALKEDLR